MASIKNDSFPSPIQRPDWMDSDRRRAALSRDRPSLTPDQGRRINAARSGSWVSIGVSNRDSEWGYIASSVHWKDGIATGAIAVVGGGAIDLERRTAERRQGAGDRAVVGGECWGDERK